MTSNRPESVATGSRPSGKHHRTRRWIPFAGAVVLVGLIIAGFWPKPVPAETAVVVRGPLRATVNEEGKTRIKQRFMVAAPVTGQLRRIPFKAGEKVVAGETTVAIIDPLSPTLLDARVRTSTEARRDTARANLEKARLAHSFSVSESHRSEKLYQDKMISTQELETVQLRENSTAKEEAAATSALRQAEAELAEFSLQDVSGTNGSCAAREVKAPASGSVLRVLEENSRVVAAGTPLVEIGDPEDLEVVIEVLSRDGAAIQPGARVEFEQWGGSEPLLGRVRLVEPAAFTKISALGVEEQRVNVIADLLTPANERSTVGDSFRVEAKIIIWEATDPLKVQAGALFRQGERWATFLLKDGRARLHEVQVGRSSGTETQIVDGLEPGSTVILYPSSRIANGQKITPIHISSR